MKVETSLYLLSSFFFFIFVCLQFFQGFFPLTFTPASENRINSELISRNLPSFDRAVLLIIDALRYDFVRHMPSTWRFITENHTDSCLIRLKVHPPTVTMPKIKTIVSGTVPSFIDVILNLNNGEAMIGDDLLHQMKRQNKNIVFYGDNVWTKMFPDDDFFTRKGDNVDSFFVNDFYEGDKNITKAIQTELLYDDWHLMILHYLGLDHIGHVLGAINPTIDRKLLEMDDVVQNLYEKFISKGKHLIFITGDHGMRDAGGHGGSSHDETLVPLVVLGTKCENDDQTFDQVDVATTFAVLLGLDIPDTSNGVVIPELLNHLNDEEKLFVLNYTSQRLVKKVRTQLSDEIIQQKEFYLQHTEAQFLHKKYLTKHDPVSFMSATLKYATSSQEMRSFLTGNAVKYDMRTILISTIAAFTILLVTITVIFENSSVTEFKMTVGSVIREIFFLFAAFLVSRLGISDVKSSIHYTCLVLTLWIIVSNIRYLMKNWSLNRFLMISHQILSLPKDLTLLLIFITFHTFSLVSSSFVEEEHQTWYYFFNTFAIILFVNDIKNTFKTRIRPKWSRKIIPWFVYFFLHTFVRRLNQTGDKWINVPDVGDFLVKEENRMLLSLFVVVGLGTVMFSLRHESTITKGLSSVCLVSIYMYRAVTNGLILPIEVPTSICLNIFWTSLILIVIKKLFTRGPRIKIILISIVLLSTLLHKPHNVILTGLCVITSDYFTTKMRNNRQVLVILVHFCIGKVFYFYQGNSNSLATIDLNAGYVGLEHFSYITVGMFLTLNTFNGQILSYIMLVKNLTTETRERKGDHRKKCDMLIKTYTVLTMIPICVYLCVMILFRYHLFIWTVFSPNLFYKFYTMLLNFVMASATFVLNKYCN